MEAEDIIRASLEKSIPALVPLKKVVQAHLIDPPSEDEEEEQVEEEEEEDQVEEDEDDEGEDELADSEEEDESGQKEEQVEQDEQQPETEEEETETVEVETGVILDKEDEPVDQTAAEETVLAGDSEKEIKLKVKARRLHELIEGLKDKQRRVPKRNKTVIEAIQQEIDYREGQLNRVRRKLQDE